MKEEEEEEEEALEHSPSGWEEDREAGCCKPSVVEELGNLEAPQRIHLAVVGPFLGPPAEDSSAPVEDSSA